MQLGPLRPRSHEVPSGENSKELLPLLRGEQMTFAQAQTFTLIALSEVQLQRLEQQ